MNVTYLVGGFFFSLGGWLSIVITQAPSRGRRSAVVLFVGTLLFAVSLVAAFAEGLTPRQSDGWIWLPDILGCVCFLVSGHLAMLDVGGGRVRSSAARRGLVDRRGQPARVGPVLPCRCGRVRPAGHRRRRSTSDWSTGGRSRGRRASRSRDSSNLGEACRALQRAPIDEMTPSQLTDAQAEALFGNRFLTEAAPSTTFPDERDVAHRRDAPGGRGPGHGGRPAAQPRHVRHHLDGAGGAAADRREPAHATSSTTRSTRSRPRSSSAACGCWPTSSTRPGRRPGAARRAPPRRSCSARCP